MILMNVPIAMEAEPKKSHAPNAGVTQHITLEIKVAQNVTVQLGLRLPVQYATVLAIDEVDPAPSAITVW